MPEEITYRKLCDLYRDEKASNSMVKLPLEFDASLAAFVAKGGNDGREKENAERMLQNILRLRRQKIIFRALAGKGEHKTEGMTEGEHALFDRVCALVEGEEGRMAKIVAGKYEAAPYSNGKTDLAMGATEKTEIYGKAEDDERLLKNAAQEGQRIAKNEATEAAFASDSLTADFKKLRILKDVQAFRGLDGKTWGPYKTGDEVSLPPEEAQVIERGRLAETVQ